MKKVIKFEKPGCQPCEMVSAVLDEAGVVFEAINPFDQPGVDNYKKNMYQLLEKM